MADAPEPSGGGEKTGTFGFLTRKLGPFPVWVWGLIGFGVYYWYTHFGPGKPAASATTAPKAQRPRVVIINRVVRPKKPGIMQTGNEQVPGQVPGDVATQNSAAFDAWAPAEQEPARVYAPGTHGSVYG